MDMNKEEEEYIKYITKIVINSQSEGKRRR